MEFKDTPENKFWIIEVTNLIGKKGFLIETKNGISFSVDGYHIDTKQFYSEEDARDYVKESGIYKKGKIRLVSNQEIMEKYATPATEEVFVIENEKGEHLFFDNGTEKYYFGNKKVGYCCWFSKDDVDMFIKYRQPEFPHHVLIAVQMNDPGAEPVK